MTQSSNLRFFGLTRDRKNQAIPTTSPATTATATTRSPTEPSPPPGQTNVHGWLMNVPGYREECEQKGYSTTTTSTIVDEDNNGIPIVKSKRLANGRPESISSVSSGDSVNLDDLIKNNFTVQVDDETDLPNLADLDLDDSADDFWKLNDSLTNFRPSTITTENKLSNDRSGHELLSIDGPFDENEFIGMGKMNSNEDDDLMNWSPESSTEEKLDTLSNASSRTAQSRLHPPSRFSPDQRIKTQRSGSLSSENSLTSQSTITTGGNGAYARYGMAPMIYPSESTTSNSSRSHSRLSDYSASSSQASSNATSIPRASSRASSSIPSSNTSSSMKNGKASGLRRPSDHHIDRTFRSSSRIGGGTNSHNNTSIPATTSGSRLAKRATHVPLPSSRGAPKPHMVTSSRSTGLSNTRLPSRASHIPSPRTNAASPEPRSPTLAPARNNSNSNRPRSPFANSRIGGIRSPTPTGGTPRNSIFSSSESRRQHQDKESHINHNSNSNNNSNNNNNSSRIGRPPSAAGKSRPTGLRPPSAIGKASTTSRKGAA